MTRATMDPERSARELQHAIRNFLNLVVTTGQVGLDPDLDYPPRRALEAILEGARELDTWLRPRPAR